MPSPTSRRAPPPSPLVRWERSRSVEAVPRFVPAKSGLNKPWQGLLYRFNFDSESRLGCVAANAATLLTGGQGDPKDLNRDGDYNDIFLMYKAGDPVVEKA